MLSRHVVTLEGGLGNQLFQFAYALNLDSGTPILDNRRRDRWGEPLRKVLLPGSWRAVSWIELALAVQSPRVPVKQNLADRLWRKFLGQRGDNFILKEGETSTPRQGRAPVVLHDGYFQVEDFASRQRERLLDALIPSLLERHPSVEDSDADVAISFRLAQDYERFGVLLPDGYYENVVDQLISGRRRPVLHVCADDQERASALLKRIAPAATVVDHSLESPVDQLRVLASARTIGISNSTFAWWGAWLGDQLRPQRRVVYCPTHWLANSDDIMPLRWERIPTARL